MKNKKPARSVSSMNVLGDIRGLLSVNKEPGLSNPARSEAKPAPPVDTTALEAEVKNYRVLIEKLRDELDKVKSENNVSAQKQFKEIEKLKNENQVLIQKHREEIIQLKSENKAPTPKPPEIDKLKNENKAQVQKLLDEIDKLKSENKVLVQKQQDLDKLRNENNNLIAKLDTVSKTRPASGGTGKADLEIAQMQANKDELSSALSQVESILQLKSKELMGRLARVYQEAAQGEIALEFRKGRDQLESLENLAHFVQALLNE